MKRKFFAPILFFITASFLSAQTQSNLDVVYGLIDKSVAKADSLIGGKQKIFLSVSTSPVLEILKPRIIRSFSDKGFIIQSSEVDNLKSINYSITSVKVEYKNSFSEGFLGSVYFEREVYLRYGIVIRELDRIEYPFEFIISIKDTVSNNQIDSLETQTLPFTHASIPEQSILSNLWEPIVVVGTLIVTIILLFSVRSK